MFHALVWLEIFHHVQLRFISNFLTKSLSNVKAPAIISKGTAIKFEFIEHVYRLVSNANFT